MAYSSLHKYLEDRFTNINTVTDTMVKEAKRDYRKMYLSRYQKRYREKHIQITFRISKKKYQQFQKKAKKKHIKVTTLIKQRALKKGYTSNFHEFQIQVLQAIDMVEEAIEERTSLDLSELLKLLEIIQKQLA